MRIKDFAKFKKKDISDCCTISSVGMELINEKNHLQGVKSFILGLAHVCTSYEGKFSERKISLEINSTITIR